MSGHAHCGSLALLPEPVFGVLLPPLVVVVVLPLPVDGPVARPAEGMAGPAEGSDMMCTMPGGSHLAKQPLQLSTRQTMPELHCLLVHGFLSPLQLKISPAQPAVARWRLASKHASTKMC